MLKMYTTLATDWGYMAAVWTDRGLWELEFPVQDNPSQPESEVSSEVELWSKQLRQELAIYLRGFAISFGVPIDWRGYTAFQAEVLRFTASIPYGQTVTYGDVGQAIGRAKGARAVGGALHINRVPIVIPCHRVLGAKGKLTGFAGGLEMKQALLLLETNDGSAL